MKKKITGAATPLERHVQKWMNQRAEDYDNGAEGVLNDLMKGGCASGYVRHLIYYTHTVAFFKKYRKEIAAMLAEGISDMGSIEGMFGDKWDKEDPLAEDDTNRNLLAWYGFEETALRLARNNEINY